ncbi:hypothetical protein [Streptomyces sp. P9-A2]|uniref:hypothetical protein n=1 Tax=Streptomyces sp. P9-A2 TaxID=3072284 RepID=UPI002FC8176D
MTHTEKTAPPADYRLLLPEGWFRIPLDPEQRDRSVDALVERQFHGIDNAPHLKEELRADLRHRAAEAHRGGGIELYLSLQEAGPFTVPASLLVSLAPAPPRRTAAAGRSGAGVRPGRRPGRGDGGERRGTGGGYGRTGPQGDASTGAGEGGAGNASSGRVR